VLHLVAQCFRQGGYRVHTMGFHPEDGRKAVPCFPEISRAGGGRSFTLEKAEDMERLGLTIFLCLFSPEAQPAVESLGPTLRAMFTS